MWCTNIWLSMTISGLCTAEKPSNGPLLHCDHHQLIWTFIVRILMHETPKGWTARVDSLQDYICAVRLLLIMQKKGFIAEF